VQLEINLAHFKRFPQNELTSEVGEVRVKRFHPKLHRKTQHFCGSQAKSEVVKFFYVQSYYRGGVKIK
jgi:hypothetical protein